MLMTADQLGARADLLGDHDPIAGSVANLRSMSGTAFRTGTPSTGPAAREVGLGICL
jgi:hypothetical protein